MSLEKELVFQLRNDGNNREDVLDIVERMSSPNGKGRAVKIDSKIIDIALSQYEAREKLTKRKECKKTFKSELKDLIEKEKKNIEDNYPNLLSFSLYKATPQTEHKCLNCGDYTMLSLEAKIKYLNGTERIPVKNMRRETLFRYCERCGFIKKDN